MPRFAHLPGRSPDAGSDPALRGCRSTRPAAACAALAAWLALVVGVVARAAPAEVPATPEALADAMRGRRVVLLGEVHDNGEQHVLRAAALRRVIERGARPAIAFEQFDRERQGDIDRARREQPRDADRVIAAAQGAPSWNWTYYRPFVALALEYDLPIVAANLSRADAMKIATGGVALSPPPIAPAFQRAHEQAIASGHCDLLPANALPGMARAQIARDRALAAAIAPHATRGVVLLTGNGHVRTDIGVPAWLAPEVRAAATSIALLERGDPGRQDDDVAHFDAFVLTERVARPDPCAALRQRMPRDKGKPGG